MKYNIGCGYDKKIGYVNVDYDREVNPDRIVNLNANWKLENAEEILCFHVLEHLADLNNFFKCANESLNPNGILKIQVPCGFHFTSIEDPTHIRFFTPETFRFFSTDTHKHYNTAKPYHFEIVKKELKFKNGFNWLKYWLTYLFLNYSLALSFVEEIYVEMKKC
jgi:hypothetical protein